MKTTTPKRTLVLEPVPTPDMIGKSLEELHRTADKLLRDQLEHAFQDVYALCERNEWEPVERPKKSTCVGYQPAGEQSRFVAVPVYLEETINRLFDELRDSFRARYLKLLSEFAAEVTPRLQFK